MSTTIADRPSRIESGGVFETPFPHAVIEHWAPPELVRAAEAEWPEGRWPHWHRYDNGKLATKDPLRFPPACAELVRRMLCLPVGELLGVDGAFGDWNCHGAGLHTLPPGASLGVHLDSDHHPQTGWWRACNAVLFVNSEWHSAPAANDSTMINPASHGHKPPVAAWGGEFELWNADGTECDKRIKPQFNRLVLFVPSDVSYHAVSEVTGPETRKTLTVFFWRHPGAGCLSTRPRAEFRSA
ncbi:MAG: 2OG-Fe(II) oxygenase [Planctomycetaceae bacterium]